MSRNMLQEVAYELYKQDWIDTHSTKEQRLMSMQEYYEAFLMGDCPFNSYEEYLYEYGFDGEVYASLPEFVVNEYQNEDYMRHLLGDEIYVFFKEEEKEFKEREER